MLNLNTLWSKLKPRSLRQLFFLGLAVLLLIIPGACQSPPQAPVDKANIPGNPGHEGGAGDATSSNYIATLEQFAIETYSFNFPNYGNEPNIVNLTPRQVERLFGARACGSREGGNCILTPPAKQWMEDVNDNMGGGHCDGMASLSLLLFKQALKPSDFGGSSTYELTLEGNAKLQQEIAYWWATQTTLPTRQAKMITGNDGELKPSQVLDKLQESFKAGAAGELYTLIIRKPDNTDGHAFTPFAIADRGDGTVEIVAYDNNHPDKKRAVVVNRAAETWSYYASTNPDRSGSLYEGNAETKTLGLTPLSARLEPQVCPFCPEEEGGAGPKALSGAALAAAPTPAQPMNEIWLDGAGQLWITDEQNRRYGMVGKQFVKEIPGVSVDYFASGKDVDLWADDVPPTYYVPTGIKFTLTIDGSQLKKASKTNVTLIGPGYDLGIEGISLDPNQQDTLTLSPNGQQLIYKTKSSESPNLVLGFDGQEADYGFELQGVDLDGGGTMTLNLEREKGQLSINTKDNQKPGKYAIFVTRIDPKGEHSFFHDGVVLNPNDTAYLDYENWWTGKGGTLPLKIDRGSDGTIDETLSLSNDKK